MHTILDTENLDPRSRFAGFQQAVCQIAYLGTSRASEKAFKAHIRRSKVGIAECSFLEFDAVTIERRLADIARERKNDYLLALHVEGNVRMQHLGRELNLREGDFTICDSALPYRIEANSPAQRMILRFPRSEFVRRGLATQAVCGRVYRSDDDDTSGLASRLLRILAAEPFDLVSEAGHSLTTTLLNLIAEAQSEDGAAEQISLSQDHIIQRIRTIASTHMLDADLSVARVAAMAGISVRYLHQVFGASGTSLRKWIEEERLERARRALESRHQGHRTIQEIALDCGFNDPGHFGRRFLKKYGCTPSQARATSVAPKRAAQTGEGVSGTQE